MFGFLFRFHGAFLLFVSILLSVALLQSSTERKQALSVGIQATALAPAQYLIHKIIHLKNLARENRSLREENIRLALAVSQLREAGAENVRLRRLLQFQPLAALPLYPAEVVGHNPGPSLTTLIINAGTSQGLQSDMPVLTSTGLVGKVLDAYPLSSLVQLLVDPNSRTGVRFSKTREPGILRCDNGETPSVRVAAYLAVEPGDTVVTSGLGGIFPKGLLVGTVRQVRTEPNSIFKQADLNLFTPPRTVEEVFVLKQSPSWQIPADEIP
jgi:rod shape-determining protein MreC